MHKTAATLRRFAAAVPGVAFPKDISQLTDTQRMRLAQVDPELLSVMDGTCDALTEAAVLDGSFSDTSSTPSLEQQRFDRVEALARENPFATGDLTRSIELASLDPARAEALRKEAEGSKADPSAAERAAMAHAAAEQRVASLNAAKQFLAAEQSLR